MRGVTITTNRLWVFATEVDAPPMPLLVRAVAFSPLEPTITMDSSWLSNRLPMDLVPVVLAH